MFLRAPFSVHYSFDCTSTTLAECQSNSSVRRWHNSLSKHKIKNRNRNVTFTELNPTLQWAQAQTHQSKSTVIHFPLRQTNSDWTPTVILTTPRSRMSPRKIPWLGVEMELLWTARTDVRNFRLETVVEIQQNLVLDDGFYVSAFDFVFIMDQFTHI